MPEESDNEVKKTFQLVREREPNLPVYYANGVQINFTQWDAQFIFEQVLAPPAGSDVKEVVARQGLAVIMSPEHARRFLEFFTQQAQKAARGEVMGPEDEVK